MTGTSTRPPDALSLCMIVKNEEHNLPRCLDSVRDLAGECIVVDTGSTDATPRIAAGYGAEVIPFNFDFVDFAAARNHALSRAHGRWILMLDLSRDEHDGRPECGEDGGKFLGQILAAE